MEPGRTNLTEAARSVQLLKIDGYCVTAAMSTPDYIKSSWNVGGLQWEVHFYPKYFGPVPEVFDQNIFMFEYFEENYDNDFVVLTLKLVSEPPEGNKLRANLSCRLVDPRGNLEPSEEKSVSDVFKSREHCSPEVYLFRTREVASSGYLVDDSLTVKCTITVLRELPDVVVPAAAAAAPPPSSDLQRDFGELLRGQWGADVTFVLESGGERFPAHKAILAARSPVFMAEFFGDVNERTSQCVRIEDMEAPVFKAMLHFIYTNTAPPELDEDEAEAALAMAQHLLAAAHRYGLDKLKQICEAKLSGVE